MFLLHIKMTNNTKKHSEKEHVKDIKFFLKKENTKKRKNV